MSTFVFLLCLFLLGYGEEFESKVGLSENSEVLEVEVGLSTISTSGMYESRSLGQLCPKAQIIRNVKECEEALAELNAPVPTVKYRVNMASIPPGCSYRPAGQAGANEGHFSVGLTGMGQFDLQPICKVANQKGPYRYLNPGEECPEDQLILKAKECERAYVDLNLPKTRIDWNRGHDTGVPRGCSYQTGSNRGHFSTANAGQGRSDLRPVCKIRPYRFLNLGTTCEEGQIIKSKKECEKALKALGAANPTDFWSGNTDTIPKGCSYQVQSNKPHWNTATNQKGRPDLRPVCKKTYVSWGPGEQCPYDMVIPTEEECLKAIRELNMADPNIRWTGNYNAIPVGCSYSHAVDKAHFNKAEEGGGRNDLSPICRIQAQHLLKPVCDVARGRTSPCNNIHDRGTCLTSKDNEDQECGWCKTGACTKNDSNQCQPENWLQEQGSALQTGYETCLNEPSTCRPQFNMNKHLCSTDNFKDDFFGKKSFGNKAAVTMMNLVGSMLTAANFTVCFGNLDTEEFNEKKGEGTMAAHGCEAIIPVGGSMSSVSFQVPVVHWGVCSLISSCSNIPTVAFALNDQALDWIFGKIAMMVSGVPSPLFDEILRKLNTNIAMGISPTGDFTYEVSYWQGGRSLTTINFKGHFFFSMINQISLWDLISPPTFVAEFTGKLAWVKQKFLNLFNKKLKNPDLFQLRAETLMMLDLSGIVEGVGESIDCVILGKCKTSASQMMKKVLYGTNFLFQNKGSFIIDLKQIYNKLPTLEINLESSQFMKYGYGVYAHFGIDQTKMIEDMFKPLCEMFQISTPRVALQIQSYINQYGIGLQADATWFKLSCEFTWEKKSLDCTFNGDVFSAFVEMIGDAINLIGDKAQEVVTKAGIVLHAGAQAAAREGQRVFNGLVLGVSKFKGRVKDLWESFTDLWSLDDFCDCNMRGALQIKRENGRELFELKEDANFAQRVTWSSDVHTVYWRCKDDDNWKKHTMKRAGRIWSVQYKYEWKSPCPNLETGGSRLTGRVEFITTGDISAHTSESVEEYVGNMSPEDEVELSKEPVKCPQCQEVYKAYHDCQSTAVGEDGECFHRDGKIALKCSLRVCEDLYIENTKCHHTHCDPDKSPELDACLEQYHAWSYCVIDADIQTCQDELTKEEEDQCIEEACKETETSFQECLNKEREALVGQGSAFIQMTSNSHILPFAALLSGITLVYILQRRNNKIEETMPLLEDEI